MARINVFGLGLTSRSRAVTAARSQNIFFEARPMGEKAQIVAYGTPGLNLFGNAGDTPWRGLLPVETTDYLYGTHRGTFYQIDNAGTLTSRGTLNTVSGRVDGTHDGTDCLIVDGAGAYTYETDTTTFAAVSDNDLIANPKSCAWLDQYFIVENGSVFQISTNPASWNATDIGVPESSPDGIVRVFVDHGEIILFGALTIEFWTNTGATDFPFAPLKSSTAEWGCAAMWSVCKYNDSVAFLGKNRLGQVSVMKLQGYIPHPISTPDLDSIINKYGTTADATAFSYMLGGHPMYQINFPSAGYSWLYDGLSQHWSPVKSFGISRQRNELSAQYLNKTITANYTNGELYTLREDVFTENGDMIERELISENIATPDLERFAIDRFRVDMETGVGLPNGQGSNPQMMLQVSRDFGNSYGAEMWQTFGAIGKHPRVEWRRIGASNTGQFVLKVRMTDPVKFAMVSASINARD